MKYEEEFNLMLLAKPLALKFKQLDWLYDTKHNVGVRKMQIISDLQVGYVYDFTFEQKCNEDASTYSLIILKKEENNIYYLAEFENGAFCKTSENSLHKNWKKCNISDYGIDLDNCVAVGKAVVENTVRLVETNNKTTHKIACPNCGSENGTGHLYADCECNECKTRYRVSIQIPSK